MNDNYSNSISEKWDQIKENIRQEYDLSNISYSTWIEPLKLYKVEEDTVLIIIPFDKAHAINYISSKYKNFFQVTISEMMNKEFSVSFILEKDIETEADAKESQKKSVYNLIYENANLNPKYKFDTFVEGPTNNFARSAALAVAEMPGRAYNPLFIYGNAGLGKTHLMHSIGHFILEQNPEIKVLYVTSEHFTNEVIESIRSGNAATMTKLREKYRSIDVLLIDDIQFIIGKESTQEEFFHTFNVLHTAGKQIVLSSDKPPREMEMLEERYRSRFEWGLIVDIQIPNYEMRIAILKKKAENYDKKINNAIFEYIANNIQSNIRELEGAFNKIIAFSRLNKISLDKLTLSHAEEALKDVIYPSKSSEITSELIMNIVAEHFEVSPDDIKSKKRNAEFVMPRQVYMYLCRYLTDASLVGIAKTLGKKDHTTIIHGIDKIEEELKYNEELKNKINIIKNILSPS